MCWCTPGVRTPCCGSPDCHVKAREAGNLQCHIHRVDLTLINVSLLDTQEERLTAAEAAVIARSVRENRYREEIRKILGEIRAAAAEGSYKLSFEGIISTETHANLVSRGFKVATRSDRNEGWVDISWG